MFENNGHIFVDSHGVGTDNPVGSRVFHKHNYSVNLNICCNIYPLRWRNTVENEHMGYTVYQ